MRETAWLIEMVAVPGTGNYWKGFAKFSGWGEVHEAVRFARKQDAEQVIKDIGRLMPEGAKLEATEHMWIDETPNAQVNRPQKAANGGQDE